jgi:predicted nucleic acid-binding protein
VILADTSVWVDHLRAGSGTLEAELVARNILIHPFVVGEIAMGHLSPRKQIMEAFDDLPAAIIATDREVLQFVEPTPPFRYRGWLYRRPSTGRRSTDPGSPVMDP